MPIIQPDSTHRGVPGLHAPESILDDEDAPPSHAERRARLVHSDEARARRRRLGRIVGVVVAVAGAICVAAVARAITTDRGGPTLRPAVAAAMPTPAAQPNPLATTVTAALATPSAAAPAAAPSASAEAVTKPDPAAARDAKRKAQRALDSGKLALAIEAGERAVALDEADAESWLILGAAYQSRGNSAEARRCFSSCLRLGKRGPRGECAAMLR